MNYKIFLNYRDPNEKTALMSAVYRQDISLVKLLLAKGADPTIESLYFGTALHIAITSGYDGIIEMIIEAECHKFRQDRKIYLSDAIHSAYHANNFAIISKLVELGASIDYRNSIGKTVLHLAAEDGDLKLVKHLIELGADVNAVDHRGYLQRTKRFSII